MKHTVVTLLLIVVTGLLLCSFIGMLGGYYWGFDLLAHFRFQYVWLSVIFLFTSLLTKQRILFLLSSFVLIVNILLISDTFTNGGMNQQIQHGDTVTFISLNVQHDGETISSLEQMVSQNDSDVVVLVEVSEKTVRELSDVLLDYGSVLYAARDNRDTFGVGVLAKNTIDANLKAYDFGKEDILSVIGEFEINNTECEFIAAHTMYPFGHERTKTRNDQLFAIADYAKGKDCFITLGDFNITPWSPIYKQVLERGELLDSRAGFGLQTSWPTFLPSFMQIPIDHALVSSDVRVIERKLLQKQASDHLPLLITIIVE